MKTGLARKILQHLADHGPETTVGLTRCLQADSRAVANSVGTLHTDSKIRSVAQRLEAAPTRKGCQRRNCHVYAITLLGRENLAKPERAVAAPIRKPLPPAMRATGEPETVDEFLARGGKVEQVATQWSPPPRYPQFRGRVI